MIKHLSWLVFAAVVGQIAFGYGALASEPDTGKRIDVLEKDLIRHPNHFRYHESLDAMDLCQKAGRQQEAMIQCDLILQHKPFDQRALQLICGKTDGKKSEEISKILLEQVQRWPYCSSVRSACFLTAADLAASRGDFVTAQSLYQRTIENNFTGTVVQSAAARVSLNLLAAGMAPQDPKHRVEEGMRILEHSKRPVHGMNVFLLETNKLLGREADALQQCELILAQSLDDEYVMNWLSDWTVDVDKSKAAANYAIWSQKYPNLPRVKAACQLRVADIYAASGQTKKALQLYSAVIAQAPAAAEPYKVVAIVSKDLITGAPLVVPGDHEGDANALAQLPLAAPDKAKRLSTSTSLHDGTEQSGTEGESYDVLEGPFRNERQALKRKILSAQQSGVGISGYMSKFNQLEALVAASSDEHMLKKSLDDMAADIDRQLLEIQYKHQK